MKCKFDLFAYILGKIISNFNIFHFVHLINKVIIIYMLLLLIIPVGYIHSKEQNFRASSSGLSSGALQNQVIGGNTVVGNNLTRSYFTVDGNLTIPRNVTLKLINTVVTFSFLYYESSFLNVSGNLSMYNSEITMDGGRTGNNFIDIFTSGSHSQYATLSMFSSTLAINGTLSSNRSRVTMNSSTVIPLSTNTAHISYSFENSNVMIYRSLVTGLRQTSRGKNFTAGNAFVTQTPYSHISYMGFAWYGVHQNSLINTVKVRLQYGGYTKGSDSYMLFNISGVNDYRYVFGNTGSYENKTISTFSFPVVGPLLKLKSLEGGNHFTTYLSMVPYTDNITIYNMTVTLISNDTVSLTGISSYNYYAANTTLEAISSGFDLNYYPEYDYRNMYSPEKNSFFVTDKSVLSFVGSYSVLAETSYDSPAFYTSNSSVRLFSIQKFYDSSAEGPVYGMQNSVTPVNGNHSENSYASQENSAMLSLMDSLSNYSLVTNSTGYSEVPLLRMTLNGSSPVYYGNYAVSSDGVSTEFSESSDSILITNSSNVQLRLNLPEIQGNLSHSRDVYGGMIAVRTSIKSQYSSSGNISAGVLISNATSSLTLHTFNLSVKANSTETVNFSTTTGSAFVPGTYKISLVFSSNGPVFNRNGTLYTAGIAVYRNISLGIHESYNISSNGLSVHLNITVVNNGNQWSNNTTVSASFYSYSILAGYYNETVSIGPNSSERVTFNEASKIAISNATISATSSGMNLPVPSSRVEANIKFVSPPVILSSYYLRVTQSGLPAGTMWGFTVNNTSYDLLQPSVRIGLSEGLHTLRISGINGYSPAQYLIHVNLTANRTVDISYTENVYSVKFSLDGPQITGGWYIKVSGHNLSENSNSLIMKLPNGTYQYQITLPSDYSSGKSSGYFSINGDNVSVNVSERLVPEHSPLQLLEHYAGMFSPVLVAAVSATLWYTHRSFSRSVYYCSRCGKTTTSFLEKCDCRHGMLGRKKV